MGNFLLWRNPTHPKDSVELLEYILHTYFGFDKEVVMFEKNDDEGNKIFHWYSAHHCTHRSKLTGEVVGG